MKLLIVNTNVLQNDCDFTLINFIHISNSFCSNRNMQNCAQHEENINLLKNRKNMHILIQKRNYFEKK